MSTQAARPARRWRRFTIVAALALAAMAPLPSARADTHTWDYVGGGTWQTEETPTTAPVSDPDLDRVEMLIYHGDYKQAFKLGIAWDKAHRDSPVRDRCLFLIAECEYRRDKRIHAFYYLDELMDQYPSSQLYYAALDKQYEIADDFLNGHKIRFLGMPVFGASDEAIEMMYRIQQRSPGSPLAEQALLRTADWYYSDRDFDLAKDAYASYIRSYPRSAQIPRIRLRRAFSSLAEFRGLLFDPTGIIDARAELLDIERDYPALAEQENVPAVIVRIDSAFARKILLTGDYYQRTNEPRGAVYQYRFLTEAYPDSPEAAEARDRLAKMPAWTKTEPAPPPADGYAPSTQPTANAQ